MNQNLKDQLVMKIFLERKKAQNPHQSSTHSFFHQEEVKKLVQECIQGVSSQEVKIFLHQPYVDPLTGLLQRDTNAEKITESIFAVLFQKDIESSAKFVDLFSPEVEKELPRFLNERFLRKLSISTRKLREHSFLDIKMAA